LYGESPEVIRVRLLISAVCCEIPLGERDLPRLTWLGVLW